MGDGAFSIWHIAIVVVLGVVLFYRGDKLPDMARSVGRSLRVFKTEIKGLSLDDNAREKAASDAATPAAQDAQSDAASNGLGVGGPQGVAPVRPALEAPTAHPVRVVAEASEPIAVRAEVVRAPEDAARAARPRPRPAGSAPRR